MRDLVLPCTGISKSDWRRPGRRMDDSNYAIDALLTLTPFYDQVRPSVASTRRFLVRTDDYFVAYCGLWPDNEGPRHRQGPHSLCGPLCAPRYAVALGDAADHQRIPAADDAGQLRLHRQVPALCFQLDRLQPLPPDEGVLPARLCQDDTVRFRGP